MRQELEQLGQVGRIVPRLQPLRHVTLHRPRPSTLWQGWGAPGAGALPARLTTPPAPRSQVRAEGKGCARIARTIPCRPGQWRPALCRSPLPAKGALRLGAGPGVAKPPGANQGKQAAPPHFSTHLLRSGSMTWQAAKCYTCHANVIDTDARLIECYALAPCLGQPLLSAQARGAGGR